MIFYPSKEKIYRILQNQLSSFWEGLYDWAFIEKAAEVAFERVNENLQQSNIGRFKGEKGCIFSVYDTTIWGIFLYCLANTLGDMKRLDEANVIYYLNKVMHSVDWFYEIELPVHFMTEHPLGSVLGRAGYGDYLMVYQGVTVGGNRKEEKIVYPKLGNNIVLYANSTVLGDTIIGNNVIVSAGTMLMNEVIPDNCIVFGRTPNITIKERNRTDIKQRTSHLWKWRE